MTASGTSLRIAAMQFGPLKRREFITLLGVAAGWPLTARAQQTGRVRRIGTLTGIADEPMMQARLAAFRQGLQQLGWTDGRNVQIDYRWGGAMPTTLAKPRPNWPRSRRT